MIGNAVVTLDDALGVLSARTGAPSSWPAQRAEQERRKNFWADVHHDGMHTEAVRRRGASEYGGKMRVSASRQDSWRAQDAAESKIAQDASALRCVDVLARVYHARCLKDRPALIRLHKHASQRCQGELVVQCMRAYEEWRLTSKERALAAVYAWAHTLAPDAYPAPKHNEASLAQAFRVGKAVRARARAADLYADCYLVLAEWVLAWNRKQIRRVA